MVSATIIKVYGNSASSPTTSRKRVSSNPEIHRTTMAPKKYLEPELARREPCYTKNNERGQERFTSPANHKLETCMWWHHTRYPLNTTNLTCMWWHPNEYPLNTTKLTCMWWHHTHFLAPFPPGRSLLDALLGNLATSIFLRNSFRSWHYIMLELGFSMFMNLSVQWK